MIDICSSWSGTASARTRSSSRRSSSRSSCCSPCSPPPITLRHALDASRSASSGSNVWDVSMEFDIDDEREGATRQLHAADVRG